MTVNLLKCQVVRLALLVRLLSLSVCSNVVGELLSLSVCSSVIGVLSAIPYSSLNIASICFIHGVFWSIHSFIESNCLVCNCSQQIWSFKDLQKDLRSTYNLCDDKELSDVMFFGSLGQYMKKQAINGMSQLTMVNVIRVFLISSGKLDAIWIQRSFKKPRFEGIYFETISKNLEPLKSIHPSNPSIEYNSLKDLLQNNCNDSSL